MYLRTNPPHTHTHKGRENFFQDRERERVRVLELETLRQDTELNHHDRANVPDRSRLAEVTTVVWCALVQAHSLRKEADATLSPGTL